MPLIVTRVRPGDRVATRWPLAGIEAGTLATILARHEHVLSLTLSTDEHDRVARVTRLADAEFVVDVAIGTQLAALVRASGDTEVIAIADPELALLRGTPIVRAAEIVGAATAADLALRWMRAGTVDEGWGLRRI